MTPRKLNKKPVLVVDPEELAREREHLHLVGAQLMGEDDAELAPAERSVSPLHLAAAMPDDEDYQDYDEQDLPPLGVSVTGSDALLGLSGREAEDEAVEPAKSVGLDLDALRQVAGFDEVEEDDRFQEDAPDIAAFGSPDLPVEPATRIGLNLDALREASGFEQDDEGEEDTTSEEVFDSSAFDAAVPTELPEKRIGLDLDALRRAGGYDDDEEDNDDFPVSVPNFSAFRSPAPMEDAGRSQPKEAAKEVADGSDLADELVDFAPIEPVPLPFDPPPEPEQEPADQAEAEPAVPASPEQAPQLEPAADAAPRHEAQPEPDPEPEAELEREPEPEILAEPRAATEPTLLRVTNWWPEEEADAAPPPPSDEGPRSVAGPAESGDEFRQGRLTPIDLSEPLDLPQSEEPSEDPAPSSRDAEQVRPAHCQVRARLLRNEDHGISKPKGLRGWLRRLRLWMEGY